MQDVTLGRTDRRISAIGLGCMSLSHPGRSEAESRRVLEAAHEAGVTFFDTADKYGKGHNERLVGEVIGGRPGVTVATKVGFVGSSRDPEPVDASPEHIRRACDASLDRLGVETIDLYYLHRVDHRVPIEESVGAMAQLVEAGKVRWLGLSEVSVETLRRAHDTHPITALQSEYSLVCREPEGGVLDACRGLGTTFVAYSPLGIGLLTGRVRRRHDVPAGNRLSKQERVDEEHLPGTLAVVDAITGVADEAGCSVAQLALAWLRAQDGVVPIPGSSRLSYLVENLGAAEVELSPDVLARLDEVAPRGAVRGGRKSRLGMRLVGR